MSLDRFMTQCCDQVSKALHRSFPDSTGVSNTLVEAMHYCVFSSGKLMRPLLVYAACQCTGGATEHADPAACSIELMHAYSLVHDDLPVMDDDDFRRGKASCHKQYGEAIAILAGDALQAFAFEVIADGSLLPYVMLSDNQRLQLLKVLSKASGYSGMVGGQAMDLTSAGALMTQKQLIQMHDHKTGALIRASVMMGALSNPMIEDWQLKQLDQYAVYVGLAFQVQDDILDVVTDTQRVDQLPGLDDPMIKPTYVSVMGLSESRHFADELCESAICTLSDFGDKAKVLRQLAEYIVKRSH